jgi:hypothetical protein
VGDDGVVALDQLAVIVQVRNQVCVTPKRQQLIVWRFLLNIAFVQLNCVFRRKI